MERGQFTFYRSYYEAIKKLPQEDQVAVLMAICSYALDETLPALEGVSSAIFMLIKPTLDTGRRKAASGQRGGKAEVNDKQDESKAEANSKQNGSKQQANNNQTASEKEREIEKEKENECYIKDIDHGEAAATKSVDAKFFSADNLEEKPIGEVQKKQGGTFDQFWQAYPRKVARKKAESTFVALVKKGVAPRDIIAGAEAYAAWCEHNAEAPQYIAHPTTWLNGGRWSDELVDKRPRGQPKCNPMGKAASEYNSVYDGILKVDGDEDG